MVYDFGFLNPKIVGLFKRIKLLGILRWGSYLSIHADAMHEVINSHSPLYQLSIWGLTYYNIY